MPRWHNGTARVSKTRFRKDIPVRFWVWAYSSRYRTVRFRAKGLSEMLAKTKNREEPFASKVWASRYLVPFHFVKMSK